MNTRIFHGLVRASGRLLINTPSPFGLKNLFRPGRKETMPTACCFAKITHHIWDISKNMPRPINPLSLLSPTGPFDRETWTCRMTVVRSSSFAPRDRFAPIDCDRPRLGRHRFAAKDFLDPKVPKSDRSDRVHARAHTRACVEILNVRVSTGFAEKWWEVDVRMEVTSELERWFFLVQK